ncbi:MAG TPA: acyltransferase family protein [Gaiellaceae bacterium]
MPPPEKRPHITYRPGLDGLRALAVTAVFLFHAKPHASGDPWVPGGSLGVDLFFVLSGYLITSLLLAEWDRDGKVRLPDFWKRRARRLFPAVVVVILAALILSALFARDVLGATRGDGLSALFYVNNWHQIYANQSYLHLMGAPSLLQHLWSLSVEEQFYILWPFLLVGGLLLLGRKYMPLLVIGGIGVSATLMWVLFNPYGDPSRVYFGTDTRAFLLLMGGLLAFLWPHVERIPRYAIPVLDGLGLAALGITIWLFFNLVWYEQSYYHGGDLAASFCFAVLIAAVAHPGTLIGKAFGVRPLRWVGERSYGIYLWHYPIIVLLVPGVDWGLTGAPAIFTQAVLVVLAAGLSYRFIEQPIRTRRLQKRLREFAPQRRMEIVTGTAVALVGAFLLLFVVPSATSAQASSGPPPPPPPKKHHHPGGGKKPGTHPKKHLLPRGHMLALGDSVMLGCASALRPALDYRVRVDAVVGRQINDTITDVQHYRAKHRLPPTVIIQVGNNGPLYYNDLVRLKAALRGVPDIVVVNVRNSTSWQDESNQAITNWLRGWSVAHLADWYGHSTDTMLYSDGTHPQPWACKIYARVIATTLRASNSANSS